jgi:hypothetical protein
MTRTTSRKSIHRATVVLNLQSKIGDVITCLHDIATKLANNASFPNITSTIPALTGALTGDGLQFRPCPP